MVRWQVFLELRSSLPGYYFWFSGNSQPLERRHRVSSHNLSDRKPEVVDSYWDFILHSEFGTLYWKCSEVFLCKSKVCCNSFPGTANKNYQKSHPKTKKTKNNDNEKKFFFRHVLILQRNHYLSCTWTSRHPFFTIFWWKV